MRRQAQGSRHGAAAHRVLVDDAEGVFGARGLDDAVEGVLVPLGRVELDDLLDLVGALRELDLGLHILLDRLEEHGDALHLGAKGVGFEAASALNEFGGDVSEGLVIRLAEPSVGNVCFERKRRRAGVEDGDSLWGEGRLDDGVDGPGAAILGVDLEVGRDIFEERGLKRRIVSTQRRQHHMGWRPERPRAER